MKGSRFYLFSITLLFFWSVSSQPVLKTHSFSSGTGTATSTSFQLNGSAGEIIGSSASTSFSLSSGFSSINQTSSIGLVAHYPLDGNTSEVSGNEYHGSLNGGPLKSEGVTGIADQGIAFDGIDDQVYHTLSSPINFTATTLSAWVYLENPSDMSGNYQNIISIENETEVVQLGQVDGSYFIFWDNEHALSFGTTTAGWHHVVVTWDGTTANGFVDGVELGPADIGLPLSIDATTFSIGADFIFGGEFLEGKIDEVKIYDIALTPTEVEELYFSYPPSPTAPQNLTVKVVGPDAIQLNWDDGPDETYYYVYWDDQGSSTVSGEQELGQNETSYTITGLTPGVEYYIEVDAGHDYDGHGNGSEYAASVIYETPIELATPVAESSIALFTKDDEITITYYPDRSYPIGDLNGAGQVYMHARLYSPSTTDLDSWAYEAGTWGANDGVGEMVYNSGSGTWEITITPSEHFGTESSFTADRMAVSFRNEDGSLIGFAADSLPVIFQMFDNSNIGPIGSFINTNVDADIYLEDGAAANPSNIQLENMSTFTMEALINVNQSAPTESGFFYHLMGRRFDDADAYKTYNGFIFYNNGTNDVPGSYTLETDGSSDYYFLFESTIPYITNTWMHMALVFDGSVLSLYVNGSLQESLAVTYPFKAADEFMIGQYEGAIDEVRIWDYARTLPQLKSTMKAPISDPTNESGLVAYWPMDEIIDGETTPDVTVFGNHLKLLGVGIPPSEIILSNNTINESHGSGALIGTFTTIDEDSEEHFYTLLDDVGGKFTVTEDGQLNQAEENIPAGTSHQINVRSTDPENFSIDRHFTIQIVGDDIVSANDILDFGTTQSSYRIIGIPFQSASIDGIFEGLNDNGQGTEWRIARYSNGSNTDLTSLGASLSGGNGYWFLSSSPVTINLGAGNLNNGTTFPKSLSSGWNMIANPFLAPITWADILAYNISQGNMNDGDIVGSTFYTWDNNSWQMHTGNYQIAMMQGGFVNASSNLSSFEFPSPTQTTGSRISLSNKLANSYHERFDEWQLLLDLRSEDMYSNISGIGIAQDASPQKDLMDIAPPPSFIQPFQLTEKVTGLTRNFKSNEETVVWDFVLTGAKEATTISWDHGTASYLEKPLMIALLPQGNVIDMRSVGEITFKPTDNQTVMVIYGDELPIELISKSISAYPNPVDKEVSFHFYVDGEGQTNAYVDLYNMSGQQIGSIQKQVWGSTWADLEYNVKGGNVLKSGVYLFKVRYRDFESPAKKLIVR